MQFSLEQLVLTRKVILAKQLKTTTKPLNWIVNKVSVKEELFQEASSNPPQRRKVLKCLCLNHSQFS
jgi:hypothetical protein